MIKTATWSRWIESASAANVIHQPPHPRAEAATTAGGKDRQGRYGKVSPEHDQNLEIVALQLPQGQVGTSLRTVLDVEGHIQLTNVPRIRKPAVNVKRLIILLVCVGPIEISMR